MGGGRAKQKKAKKLKDDCPKCDKTTTVGTSMDKTLVIPGGIRYAST